LGALYHSKEGNTLALRAVYQSQSLVCTARSGATEFVERIVPLAPGYQPIAQVETAR